MLRGLGNQTLTGSAQPLFGTTTSAAVTPMPDMQTGNLLPMSNPSQTVVPVTTQIFRKGDHVVIGAAGAFVQGSTVPVDGGIVSATTSNSITVMGLTRAHASGEFVVLALPVAQVQIQNGAAILYLGEDSSVASGSTTLISEIAASAMYTIPQGGGMVGNVIETQHLWVLGTVSDTYLPSLLTI